MVAAVVLVVSLVPPPVAPPTHFHEVAIEDSRPQLKPLELAGVVKERQRVLIEMGPAVDIPDSAADKVFTYNLLC